MIVLLHKQSQTHGLQFWISFGIRWQKNRSENIRRSRARVIYSSSHYNQRCAWAVPQASLRCPPADMVDYGQLQHPQNKFLSRVNYPNRFFSESIWILDIKKVFPTADPTDLPYPLACSNYGVSEYHRVVPQLIWWIMVNFSTYRTYLGAEWIIPTYFSGDISMVDTKKFWADWRIGCLTYLREDSNICIFDVPHMSPTCPPADKANFRVHNTKFWAGWIISVDFFW